MTLMEKQLFVVLCNKSGGVMQLKAINSPRPCTEVKSDSSQQSLTCYVQKSSSKKPQFTDHIGLITLSYLQPISQYLRSSVFLGRCDKLVKVNLTKVSLEEISPPRFGTNKLSFKKRKRCERRGFRRIGDKKPVPWEFSAKRPRVQRKQFLTVI